MQRRIFITSLAAASTLTSSNLLLANSEKDTRAKVAVLGAADLIDANTKTVINKGLKYLADRQITNGKLAGAFGQSGYSAGVAVTSLAGLAFMCSGSTPRDGKYASNIRQCTEFVLRNVRNTGYIARTSERQNSNMYGHGYAMLFLSQVYGMGLNKRVRDKLNKAIELTCKVQNREGGWRYQPVPQDADLSITVCQIMALRAAHSAGFDVSNEVREKTMKYVEGCQNSNGSFNYTRRGGRQTVALAAAGIVSYYSAGVYEGERIEKALKWIYDRRPGKAGSRTVSPMNYYYAHYYAVQAMWHAQIQSPHYWNAWYPAIRDELINQKMGRAGVWPDQRVGSEFGTAMACIILQMPLNYLPVFSP